MALKTRSELLTDLRLAVRGPQQGGNTSAADVTGFLTTLIDELLAGRQPVYRLDAPQPTGYPSLAAATAAGGPAGYLLLSSAHQLTQDTDLDPATDIVGAPSHLDCNGRRLSFAAGSAVLNLHLTDGANGPGVVFATTAGAAPTRVTGGSLQVPVHLSGNGTLVLANVTLPTQSSPNSAFSLTGEGTVVLTAGTAWPAGAIVGPDIILRQEAAILYDGPGSYTDGALTQRAATAALVAKADLVNGVVPAAQLPSYVDDVLEFGTSAEFPLPGESGKLYLATSSGRQYRWTGTTYSLLSDSGLTTDQLAALTSAANPSAANPFLTTAQLTAKADLVNGLVPAAQLPNRYADIVSASRARTFYDDITSAMMASQAGDTINLYMPLVVSSAQRGEAYIDLKPDVNINVFGVPLVGPDTSHDIITLRGGKVLFNGYHSTVVQGVGRSGGGWPLGTYGEATVEAEINDLNFRTMDPAGETITIGGQGKFKWSGDIYSHGRWGILLFANTTRVFTPFGAGTVTWEGKGTIRMFGTGNALMMQANMQSVMSHEGDIFLNDQTRVVLDAGTLILRNGTLHAQQRDAGFEQAVKRVTAGYETTLVLENYSLLGTPGQVVAEATTIILRGNSVVVGELVGNVLDERPAQASGAAITEFAREGESIIKLSIDKATHRIDLLSAVYADAGQNILADQYFTLGFGQGGGNPSYGQWSQNGGWLTRPSGIEAANGDYLYQDYSNRGIIGPYTLRVKISAITSGSLLVFGNDIPTTEFFAPGVYDIDLNLRYDANRRVLFLGRGFSGIIDEVSLFKSGTLLADAFGKSTFVHLNGNETIAGTKTFTSLVTAPGFKGDGSQLTNLPRQGVLIAAAPLYTTGGAGPQTVPLGATATALLSVTLLEAATSRTRPIWEPYCTISGQNLLITADAMVAAGDQLLIKYTY